jgi:hypothetical protein
MFLQRKITKTVFSGRILRFFKNCRDHIISSRQIYFFDYFFRGLLFKSKDLWFVSRIGAKIIEKINLPRRYYLHIGGCSTVVLRNWAMFYN